MCIGWCWSRRWSSTFIDFDLQIIPDSVTVPAMVVGIGGGLLGTNYLLPIWFQDPWLLAAAWETWFPETEPPRWWGLAEPAWCRAWPVLHGLAVSVAGFVVGGGVVWFVRWAGEWILRREAMGFGDVTLMAMIGSFLGWQPVLLVFFLAPVFALAAVAATLVLRRSREIPYGPYLSAATLLVLFAWRPLQAASDRFFGLGPLMPVAVLVMGLFFVVALWLVQRLKRLMGIPLDDGPEWSEDWTSADQLAFYANKQSPPGVEGCGESGWPGRVAGRGETFVRQWHGR